MHVTVCFWQINNCFFIDSCRSAGAWCTAAVCLMLSAAIASTGACGALQPLGRVLHCKATYQIPLTWTSSVDDSYNAIFNMVRAAAQPSLQLAC